MVAMAISTKDIFNQALDALAEAIVIPNSWLPERFRQYKEFEVVDIMKDGKPDTVQVFGQTVADLRRMLEAEQRETIDMDFVQQEKQRRIELYAQQYSDHCDLHGEDYLKEPFEIEFEPTISQEMSKLAELLN